MSGMEATPEKHLQVVSWPMALGSWLLPPWQSITKLLHALFGKAGSSRVDEIPFGHRRAPIDSLA